MDDGPSAPMHPISRPAPPRPWGAWVPVCGPRSPIDEWAPCGPRRMTTIWGTWPPDISPSFPAGPLVAARQHDVRQDAVDRDAELPHVRVPLLEQALDLRRDL